MDEAHIPTDPAASAQRALAQQESLPLAQMYLSCGRLTLSQDCVRRLCGSLQPLADQGAPAIEYLPRLCRHAFTKQGGDAAASIAVAAALCGCPQGAGLLTTIGPALTTPSFLPILCGALTGEGDRVNALLDLLAADRLDAAAAAVALLIITELCPRGQEIPPRARGLLRTWSRFDYGEVYGSFLGHAAARVSDPQVRRAAARYLPSVADQLRPPDRIQRARRAIAGVALALLPETSPLIHGPGATLRRPARTGRNELCPCGTGKKYKRCCAGLEAEPSPVAGVSREDYLARADLHVPPAKFSELSFTELAAFDLNPLPVSYLEKALLIAGAYRQLEYSERILDLLEQREIEGRKLEVLRVHVLRQAIAARDAAVSMRLLQKLGVHPLLEPEDWVGLAVLCPDGDRVGLVNRACRSALASPREATAAGLVNALLVHMPALGILVARGALDGLPHAKAEALLEEVEQARDRLGLPSRDRAFALYDRLMAGQLHQRMQEQAQSAEQARLQAQAQALQAQAQAQAARVAELERRLRLQEETLQAPGPQAVLACGGADPREDEAQRKRLQSKIAQLKSRIADGNQERARLREQLAEMSDELTTAVECSGAAEPAEGAEDDALEEDAPVDESRSIRCPIFTKAAQASLAEAPPRVAREALQSVAALCAGDLAAWRGVKQLKSIVPAMAPIWSMRVGIRHRLLFRLVTGQLEVMELLQRKDLELILKQRRWM